MASYLLFLRLFFGGSVFDVVGVETSGSSVGSPFMDSVSRDKFRLH